jgi:hypothetical protein
MGLSNHTTALPLAVLKAARYLFSHIVPTLAAEKGAAWGRTSLEDFDKLNSTNF